MSGDLSITIQERTPPYSVEAEKGVIGCVLLDPVNSLSEAVAFGIVSDWFYDLKHVEIWGAILALSAAATTIDTITLQQHLRDNGKLDMAGGIPYLLATSDFVPSSGNLVYYLKILRSKFLLRSAIAVAQQIEVKAMEDEDGEKLVAKFESDVLAINRGSSTRSAKLMGDHCAAAIQTMEDWFHNGGKPTGLTTGIPDLDKMTGGLKGGDMIVIAARPSMGKSSLAMNIAEHAAIECQHAVLVFSLEMSFESLMMRTIGSVGRINMRDAQQGRLSERDFPKAANAVSRIKRAKLFIDDSTDNSIERMRAKARRMVQQHGIKLVVVDYLQLIPVEESKGRMRQEEVAKLSAGLKSMARELGIPVIVLAQLNREIEKEKKRKPRMSDLRESGAIEQDADLIAFLHKPGDDDDDSEEAYSEKVELLIVKQRNGPTGPIGLVFLKQFTRFESLSRIDPADYRQDND